MKIRFDRWGQGAVGVVHMRKALIWIWKLLLVAGMIGIVLLGSAWFLGRSAATAPDQPVSVKATPVEDLLDVEFGYDERYSLIVDQDAATTYSESPLTRRLVEAGELPPVEQRLPRKPVVMRGVDGIGRYGGTWLRIANSVSDVANVISNRLSATGLVRWSPLGEPVQPFLAESYEVSDGHRTFTFRLREGLRWSDGHPFTVDDIMYAWESEVLNKTVGMGRPLSWMVNGGDAPVLEQLDSLTLRVRYRNPNALFLKLMAANSYMLCQSPKHYLQPYHPDYGDADFIRREKEAYGLPSDRSLYAYVKSSMNPEHPRMWPWLYRAHQPVPPIVVVRNPYYFVVDEAGHQLPYIDRIHFEVVSGDQFPLAVATGKTSMQLRGIQFEDVVEYLTRAQEGEVEVLSWYSATRAPWLINVNLNRRVLESDPVSRWKARFLGDKRFRQALSLAIDRQRIIDAVYMGVGEPSQVTPGRSSPFYSERLGQAYTRYDPHRAEELLDEMGFKRPGPNQMRLAPDGTPLTFFIDYTSFTGRGPADFIIEDWARIGVRAIARERARSLFYVHLRALTSDFTVWSSESDNDPLISPRCFIPWYDSFWCMDWLQWGTNGGDDTPRELRTRTFQAPPPDHPVREAVRWYYKARAAPSLEQQVECFHKLAEIVAEQLWTIGISTYPPQLVVKDPDLKNVPANALVGWTYLTPSNAGIETYYFRNPRESPAADAQTVDMIRKPVPRPRLNDYSTDVASVSGGIDIGPWIVRLLGVGAVLSLVLIALRHPYIGRRLLVMIPTLFVMSVLIFITIQLPPGDFLMARLIEIQEQGGENAEQQIEDLREIFHYDEPATKRYLRWVGAYWFITFSPSDTGLLQGDLGRSMATGQPVNHLIGDRLLLTVAISAGTILFTWLVAIPIGIYSAVRQYSWADYVFTLVGFLGMSVPNFLFALVLMALAGVSGLFSAEYATQPEWTWGKLIDLLKHIWIPVLVIGTSGTAGMIRVMRANLLDELRKPYVVTARAKGVRPLKLLLKYPVRVAINPFISGIGGILPALVSGGAIVAIVLSLPTIGPLLLDALMLEDMYLAGSMLMVLSLLGIVGTLLSDLLLLLVDPRIRYEGRSR